LLVVASVLFTFVGGLKSVLWNDLIQFCVYLGSAIAVLVFLRYAIPRPTPDHLRADAHAEGSTSCGCSICRSRPRILSPCPPWCWA
jgi:hypothetical protein